ncbi:hypothetical protein [Shewanella fodinae]|uniref:hypothetical protein n=1 Tax=Shewanella fodinae TaxID=552357 RepID=UPI001678F99D|nr:hypothetical protein [Shewanella fodinae]MCL2906169.1 hypothetical protein [Shewanella fodinae]GGY98880.1 hypothetical protein GCM10007169_14860 [Shewanella fodinae]
MSFNNCKFYGKTVVSGLKRGRYLTFSCCSRANIFSNVTIDKIECRTLEIKDSKPRLKGYKKYQYLMPEIKKSYIHNINCHSMEPPFFENVVFVDKLNISSLPEDKNHQLWFKKCIFVNHLEINIINFDNLTIFIENCEVKSTDEYSEPVVKLNTKDVSIDELNIRNSELSDMYFYLFRVRINSIDIKNSSLELLEAYTVDDEDANRKLYSIDIIDSFVGLLKLNHRQITHSMNFKGSTFDKPPILYGANMPQGSVFPLKNGFLSRNGSEDASSYRILRFFMESQRDRELEGMFFTLELESLINNKKFLRRIFSLNNVYSIFSEYGTNYRRPLILLLCFSFIFTLLYSLYISPKISPYLPINWDLLSKSFVFTLKQMFLPFSSLKDMQPLLADGDKINVTLTVLSIVNSLLSIACLTLSGLAIRWKFKRG